MAGPIEFLNEDPRDTMPDSEIGGADGLIQPLRPEVLSGDPLASGGHVLDGKAGSREAISDAAGVMRRAGMRPLSSSEGWTGAEDPAWKAVGAKEGGADAVVDPRTGRAIGSDVNGAGGVPGEFDGLLP